MGLVNMHVCSRKRPLGNSGCPWDEETCRVAAKGGHLDTLKWTINNGCPWNEKKRARLQQNTVTSMFKWARTNGCPWSEHT